LINKWKVIEKKRKRRTINGNDIYGFSNNFIRHFPEVLKL